MTNINENCLIEIGCEELPAKMLLNLAEQFAANVANNCKSLNLDFQNYKIFATPRRLAVRLNKLANQQKTELVVRKGPACSVAFNEDGSATSAGLGFARSCGVDIADLEISENANGSWLIYKYQAQAKSSKELLPQIIEKSLQEIDVKRVMRWADYATKFVRPIRWVLILVANESIDAKIFNLTTVNHSYGHRFHHPEKVEINHADEYEQKLNQAFVMVDFAKRKQQIKEQILAKTDKVVIDDKLLNEVVALVEWPVAFLGKFEQEFLQVPKEALIAAMRDHQKYFHCVDKDNNLVANFVFVANIESKDPKRVIAGNERVLKARLSDTAFFYQQDKKLSLESRRENSKKVIFQRNLGSLWDKSERLYNFMIHYNASENAKRAAILSKCDLLTDMVGEFAELEGIMGYYYAINDNENKQVAIALKDHYLPRFAGDNLAKDQDAILLALADRLDTLLGVFANNQQPKADKDPFKCRRLAIAIIRYCLEKDFDLKYLLNLANKSYQSSCSIEIVEKVYNFILDRLNSWYVEKNISINLLKSVLSTKFKYLTEIDKKIKLLNSLKSSDLLKDIIAINKRVSSLLANKKIDNVAFSYLQDQVEINLLQYLQEKQKNLPDNLIEYLNMLASFKKPMDDFFDKIMVMVKDDNLRNARLSLLNEVKNLFMRFADFSNI